MKSVGIICEYNPFHNGHLYHLNKVKEMFPEHVIVLVLSSSFTQRGEISIINKWDKTKIALEAGIDLVLELPFTFATQSADFFAKGAIQILAYMNCEYFVFGSESNDIDTLSELADIQLNNKEYDELVNLYLQDGINYPTALSKALEKLSNKTVENPNDLLGLSYVREIKKNNFNIKPITIKRTNDYHDLSADSTIVSASAIRNLIKEQKDVTNYIPEFVNKYINYHDYQGKIFELLKYKIISSDNLSKYQTVDEGIENRILKYIDSCKSIYSLIMKIKTKRYTYNKIYRMFLHILCGFTKEEAKNIDSITYIRVLGFNDDGQRYLKTIKKGLDIPLITNCKNISDLGLDIEQRVSDIYNLITNNNFKDKLEKPIIIKK